MVINNNVNSVLMQMQSIESMAKSTPVEVATASKQTDGTSFSDMMLKAIDTVNMNQQTAAEMSQRFEMGDKSIDLAQVMVNSQKAKISFQALNEVRNKLLTAYQDVMNMPV
ncbi:MAG: flagellar hook-basal body complex protein FliE [Gammaproteobacteria bacterium]|nr:flagellar hook-basal body complex protein FliE [Gammaproteobacteria bacterium]